MGEEASGARVQSKVMYSVGAVSKEGTGGARDGDRTGICWDEVIVSEEPADRPIRGAAQESKMVCQRAMKVARSLCGALMGGKEGDEFSEGREQQLHRARLPPRSREREREGELCFC